MVRYNFLCSWVYLEGLFSGSADIATLLPVESARFSSISTEFVALMKKVQYHIHRGYGSLRIR